MCGAVPEIKSNIGNERLNCYIFILMTEISYHNPKTKAILNTKKGLKEVSREVKVYDFQVFLFVFHILQ